MRDALRLGEQEVGIQGVTDIELAESIGGVMTLRYPVWVAGPRDLGSGFCNIKKWQNKAKKPLEMLIFVKTDAIDAAHLGALKRPLMDR